MSFLSGLFIFLLLIVCFVIFKNFHLLDENTEISKHKKLIVNNKTSILLGGFFLCLVTVIFSNFFNYFTKIIISLFFLLGLMSDKNYLSNPKTRLFLQLILIALFVIIQDVHVKSLNIEYFDLFLKNNLFSFLFTVFCFAILVNGTNFIDGLNGLVLGYYALIIISLLYLNFYNNKVEINDLNDLKMLLFCITLLLVFNFFGYIFLGDGGSYLIALIIGSYLIHINNNNINISPYYVATLLWYPAFENLFSLIRRVLQKINVSKPDNNHLHQLIYKFFLQTKIFDKNNVNSLSALIILLYNIPIFVIANIYHSKTTNLVLLIFLNVIIYLLIYFFLSKKDLINKKL